MKETIRVLLGVLLLSVATAVRAQYTYTTNSDNTLTMTSYTGSGGFLTIPGTNNGLPVTVIGNNAFANSGQVYGVTIPDSVTNIEDNAFDSFSCDNLSMIAMGNGILSIGSYAFAGCIHLNTFGSSPGTFTIPASVTSIGDGAFESDDMSGVTIPPGVTNLGGNPFSGCTSLTSIGVATNNPAYTNVSGVVYNTNLTALIAYPAGKAGTSYTVSNNITSIGTNAFGGCVNLTNVMISASVTNISGTPFVNCNYLTAINVDTNNPAYSSLAGVLFNQTQTLLIEYPPGQGGSPYTIPASVTGIGDNAFVGVNLSSVIIPDSVTSIGNYVFQGCLNLNNVIIPNSVTNLGTGIFFSCMGLTSITLPDSITSIGIDEFAATALTNITIPDSVTNIGIEAFTSCRSLTGVTIPGSVASIGEDAFSGCTALTNVTINSGVTSIGSAAFDFCPDLASITIPASVTNIGSDAFTQCSGLTAVYFQSNAPSADSTVFTDDTHTTAYYLPGTTGWGSTFGGRPTALWTPAIRTTDGFFGVQNNQFGFNISWVTNETVTVEASTSLASPEWTPLTNVTLTNGLFYFSDVDWTNYPNRYYRLSWP